VDVRVAPASCRAAAPLRRTLSLSYLCVRGAGGLRLPPLPLPPPPRPLVPAE